MIWNRSKIHRIQKFWQWTNRATKKLHNFCMWIEEYIQSNLSERHCSVFVQMTVTNVGLMYWTIVWRYALTKLLTKCFQEKKKSKTIFFLANFQEKFIFAWNSLPWWLCFRIRIFRSVFCCSLRLHSTLKKASQIQWEKEFLGKNNEMWYGCWFCTCFLMMKIPLYELSMVFEMNTRRSKDKKKEKCFKIFANNTVSLIHFVWCETRTRRNHQWL